MIEKCGFLWQMIYFASFSCAFLNEKECWSGLWVGVRKVVFKCIFKTIEYIIILGKGPAKRNKLNM